MNKLLLASLIVASTSLYAQDGKEILPSGNLDEINDEAKSRPVENKPLTTEYVAATSPDQKIVADVEDSKDFKARASHWYTTFGFEALEYDLPFAYAGAKEKFNTEKRQLYGGRLGFGREFYLGAGFMTSTRIEGYYMGTLFESAQTADPGLADEDVATIKDSGQIFGGDIIQTLSYLFDFQAKNPFMDTYSNMTFEPFAEIGIGRAQAWNKKDYNYNIPGQTEEQYDQSFKDDLTNVKLGLGFNLNSSQGFFLYLKATQNRYNINKRTTDGIAYANGQAPAKVDPNVSKTLDTVMIYSLGGGYKF
jgi:hypothetical protein